MILCANNSDDGVVEILAPPAGCKAGDKLFFEGNVGVPEPVLNPKKKIWEEFQPAFTTNAAKEVGWTDSNGELRLLKPDGVGLAVTAPTLAGACVR